MCVNMSLYLYIKYIKWKKWFKEIWRVFNSTAPLLFFSHLYLTRVPVTYKSFLDSAAFSKNCPPQASVTTQNLWHSNAKKTGPHNLWKCSHFWSYFLKNLHFWYTSTQNGGESFAVLLLLVVFQASWQLSRLCKSSTSDEKWRHEVQRGY